MPWFCLAINNIFLFDGHRFGPEDLMDKVPNVGCIVDLTATHRYYDGSVMI